MSSDKRFTRGKGPLEDGYFSETIIDNETGKTYYDGRSKPNYVCSMELIELLNNYNTENQELKKENEQLIQFKNIAIDYNIPFDKLYDTFESLLEEVMNK